MQWLFMLVGLVLGLAAGESITSGLLGALLGLAIGQALHLRQLTDQQAAMRTQLQGLAKRFEDETAALQARLARLSGVQAAPEDAGQVPVDDATVQAEQPLAEAELPLTVQADEAPPDLPALSDAWVEATPPEAEVLPEPPREPRRPRGPSLLGRGIALARNWLLGGNTVLRVGVLLLFLGLAFLLRYATEGMVVPLELRYAGVAASAMVLLGLGWWLRRRNPQYGLMLQGTGVAVLYLTVFAAMRLHPLLDPRLAFALLVLTTAFSAILAVAQNALGLAVAAALGGFAAPILTATGSGNHVALFSYFILLNAGIFAIAWFKAWRLLNLVGFVGTFGIGFAWGLHGYTPQLLSSTEPFLVVLFLMYVVIGLLFTRRKLREQAGLPEAGEVLRHWARGRTDYIDATVVFGPPLVGFGLQYAIVQHIPFATAFSALGLGLFYLVLAKLLRGRNTLLMETCLALGVVFGTLAVPLGLDARWTSATWAVEGAGIYWLGLRQRRTLARLFALLLQVGAGLAFLGQLGLGQDSLLEGAPLGALMLGVALLFSYGQLRMAPAAHCHGWERRGAPWLAVAGLAFLFLIAPLCLQAQGTAIAWALLGLVTLCAGLRLQARSFLFSAIAVQLLGGAVFLGGMQSDGLEARSGWADLVVCALIGVALVAGMLIAMRDRSISEDRRLMRGLSLAMLLGLLFVNFAVLFVLPWRIAAAVWAGSGLLIIWLSLLLQLRASFLFGLALQVAGGIAFLVVGPLLFEQGPDDTLRPLAHAGFWTPLALALAAQVGAWRLYHVQRHQQPGLLQGMTLQRLSQLLLAWGLGWWAMALAGEVLRFVGLAQQSAALLAVAGLSVAAWSWLARRLSWPALAWLCTLLMPVASVILLFTLASAAHPAAGFGWLAWGLVFAVHFWSLKRLDGVLAAGVRSAAHVFGCWLVLAVLALELRYAMMALAEQANAWRWLGWAVLPSLFLMAMAAPRAWPWPVAAYPREYRILAAAPVAVAMLGWLWLANIASDGSADPLPYLPLLNPLELGMLLVLLAVHAWLRHGLAQLGLDRHARQLCQGVVGASLFVVLTAAVFRAVHHWGSVPYELDALLASMPVQAGLSIVWTLIALPLMIFGHLRGRREFWLLGAALIGVVVAKLFFVELGNRGGLERIVSFIGVGVLLLVVGYFAPLPPRKSESAQVNA
ncbi:DUF2339 domain-containing protein [Pantoea sp. Cy-639]|uniref:DUF2339 domain-containing protein n=1 Tax=Pantoea sp. Cy-639 TaxID=2608360 RepID=UPI001420DD10|nr:DUF2339 domain-containing protein [Pantoea sp. Cy-639]NIF18223.1 DUF2339 domain-containing protein [Pantoea sp. Cy-639]